VKYWSIGEKARKNPAVVTEWAQNCRRKALSQPEPIRQQLISWADKLEESLEKWEAENGG
jgi:hypothetical protein